MINGASSVLADYPGAKNAPGVKQIIINNFPEHEKRYFEPFFGSGIIMWNKLPAQENIANDIDPDIYETWNIYLEKKQTAGEKLPLIKLYNEDALEMLQGCVKWGKDSLIYADPPYPRSARKSSRALYNYEMTDEQHQKFLDIACELRCYVAISTYDNEMYAKRLKGWRKINYQVRTHQETVTETLYMNYPVPGKLHDYRFLGDDYDLRRRLKRKAKRWVNKFKEMPLHERQAIFLELEPFIHK